MKISKIITVSMLLFVISCGGEIIHEYPQNPDIVRRQRYGKAFGDIVLFSNKKHNKSQDQEHLEPSNNKQENVLWLASVEVIGALLPIQTVNYDSKLIITQWYQDGKNQNSRIKINLLLKNKEIKRSSLSVSIFRQNKDQNGIWQDQEIDKDSLTASLIVSKILKISKEPLSN